MIKIIITAVITYLVTSVDEIPVLYLLYLDYDKKKKSWIVTLGYFIGTFFLVAISLLGAWGLLLIPVKWAIGLIGVIPIVMGVKIFLAGDDDEGKAMISANRFQTLWLKVFVITIALGADDLGVYIPLFTTMKMYEIVQMLIVFTLGTAILCLISNRLTHIEKLKDFIEEKEKYIVGTVFVAIGIIVLMKCGTFSALLRIIN